MSKKKTEKEEIRASFTEDQQPILIYTADYIFVNKKKLDSSTYTLSSSYIGVFYHSHSDTNLHSYPLYPISSCNEIQYLKENNLLIITIEQDTITISSTKENMMRFAKLLYRNFYLSCTLMNPKLKLKLSGFKKEFPSLAKIPISKSQIFQFYYFQSCADINVAYKHKAVRYIHTMLVNRNSMLDVSLLPRSFYDSSSQAEKYSKKNLTALFKSLQTMGIISGICINPNSPERSNFKDFFKTFASIISYCTSLKVVHVPNCEITDGLDVLAKSATKAKDFQVSYWDISGNQFEDFSPFATIISHSKGPITYLNLNNCNIQSKDSKKLFNALTNFSYLDHLQYLSIASISLATEQSFSAFTNFLKASELKYLDISNVVDQASAILKFLADEDSTKLSYQKKLETLILDGIPLGNGHVNNLILLISKSKTLKELSLANTHISKNNLASVIDAINANQNITKMSLNLDNLNLNGEDLNYVLGAFKLEGDQGFLKKWNKLSFASNSLDLPDLELLLSVLSTLPKLRFIDLSDNFNDSMDGISSLLGRLTKLSSLKSIVLRGKAKNKLKNKLRKFLKKASEMETLEKLDVRNHHCSESGELFATLLQQCELNTLRCSGNDFTPDEVKTLIKSIPDSLVTFDFPMNDCRQYLSQLRDIEREEPVEEANTVKELQIRATKRMAKNRQDIGCELPFECSEKAEKVIRELSSEQNELLDSIKEKKLFTHSFITEIFNLPFPFEKNSDLISTNESESTFYDKKILKKYGERDQVEVDEDLEQYEAFEQFQDIFIEDKKRLTYEFFNSPTLGQNPDVELEDFLDEDIIQAEKLRASFKQSKQSSKKTSGKAAPDEKDPQSPASKAKLIKMLKVESKATKDDEKARYEFKQAHYRAVDNGPTELETRNLDIRDLEEAMQNSKLRKEEKTDSEDEADKGKKKRSSKKRPIKSSRVFASSDDESEQKKKVPTKEEKDEIRRQIESKKKQKLARNDDSDDDSDSDNQHLSRIYRRNMQHTFKRKDSDAASPDEKRDKSGKREKTHKPSSDNSSSSEEKPAPKKDKAKGRPPIKKSSSSSSSSEEETVGRKGKRRASPPQKKAVPDNSSSSEEKPVPKKDKNRRPPKKMSSSDSDKHIQKKKGAKPPDPAERGKGLSPTDRAVDLDEAERLAKQALRDSERS